MRRIPLDAFFLAALAAVGIAEALGNDALTSADRAIGVIATLLAVALLARRRRAPVAVFVAVGCCAARGWASPTAGNRGRSPASSSS